MRQWIASLLAIYAVLGCIADAEARPGKQHTQYDEYFRKYAKHYFGVGADWHWFKSQAMAESNLKPNARSAVNARGVMQIMPATYQELQRKNPQLGEITEPRWNIAAGIFYDKQLWDRFSEISADDDRRRFMFGAYNAGATTMRRARAAARESGHAPDTWTGVAAVAPKVRHWRHRETLGYIERIEANRAQLGPP